MRHWGSAPSDGFPRESRVKSTRVEGMNRGSVVLDYHSCIGKYKSMTKAGCIAKSRGSITYARNYCTVQYAMAADSCPVLRNLLSFASSLLACTSAQLATMGSKSWNRDCISVGLK